LRQPARTAHAAVTGTRLGSFVYEQIKQRLLEGDFRAGEKLQVPALCKEYQVSKQPVMEALRRLSADGLVHVIPQVGCQVRGYARRDVHDFFQLFAAVEGNVAALAAQRGDAAQLERLREANARIDRLRGNADPAERSHLYRVLNREFHDVIHDMADSEITCAAGRQMADLSDFLINTTGVPKPLSDALDDRYDDHERLIEALATGDQEYARREMARHISSTFDLIHTELHPETTSSTRTGA
jgi:DNA-binding GntR family transcriptional regulator